VPVVSILVGSFIGTLALGPFKSWSALVNVVTGATAIMYSFAPVSLAALHRVDGGRPRSYRVPMPRVLLPAGFCSANLIIYWGGFDTTWKLAVAMLVGLVLFAIGAMRARTGAQRTFVTLLVAPWLGAGAPRLRGLRAEPGTSPGWVDLAVVIIFALRSSTGPERYVAEGRPRRWQDAQDRLRGGRKHSGARSSSTVVRAPPARGLLAGRLLLRVLFGAIDAARRLGGGTSMRARRRSTAAPSAAARPPPRRPQNPRGLTGGLLITTGRSARRASPRERQRHGDLAIIRPKRTKRDTGMGRGPGVLLPSRHPGAPSNAPRAGARAPRLRCATPPRSFLPRPEERAASSEARAVRSATRDDPDPARAWP
jgi:hypothetical protein